MRSLAAAALALVAGGCLKANATHCDNGAICREGEVCTENLVCRDATCEQRPLCGARDLVEQCLDDSKAFEKCTADMAEVGVCVDRVCEPCSADLAGCGGDTWETMTVPDGTPALNSVWMISKTHGFVGGAMGTLLEYDGRSWQKVAFPATGALTRISGTSATDIYVVLDSGQLWHYDGVEWRGVTPDLPSGAAGLKAVDAVSTTDVYAVGVTGTFVHFNGMTPWTLLSSSGPTLYDVAASSSGAIAVGGQGAVMEWDGSSISVTQPIPDLDYKFEELSGVFFHGARVLIAGASTNMQEVRPTLFEREAGTWKASAIQNASVPVVSMVCAKADYAASSSGVYHYDGASWSSAISSPQSGSLRGIDRVDGYVFAVDLAGLVWRLREP